MNTTQPATHTPGPWIAYLYGKDSYGRTIATVGANDGCNRICELCAVDLPVDSIDANARLIAAAPDLLATLSQLVFEVSHHLQSGDRGALVQNELRNAFAAISKASGVQS